MPTKPRFLAAFIVTVVGLLLIGLYIRQHKTGSSAGGTTNASPTGSVALLTPTPTPTLPSVDTSGWAVFTNSQGDFSVGYSPEFLLKDHLDPFLKPGQNVRGVSFAIPGRFYDGTNLQSGSITVTAEAGGEVACAYQAAAGVSHQIVNVGGQSYDQVIQTETDAGIATTYRVYSLPEDLICYRMFLYATSTDPVPSGQKAYDLIGLEAIEDAMLNSWKVGTP